MNFLSNILGKLITKRTPVNKVKDSMINDCKSGELSSFSHCVGPFQSSKKTIALLSRCGRAGVLEIGRKVKPK